MYEAIAWSFCVAATCVTGLVALRWWLTAHPPCSREEFERMVKQLNVVTESMAEVKSTADSLRSVIGMTKMSR